MADNSVTQATAQDVPGSGFSHRYQSGPTPAEGAFGVFAQGLKGVADNQTAKQAQMTALFPTLAAQGMVAPWTANSTGRPVQYGNQQWEVNERNKMDYDTQLKMLRTEKLKRALSDEYGFTDEDTQDRMSKYITAFTNSVTGSAALAKVLKTEDVEEYKAFNDQLVRMAATAVSSQEEATGTGKTRVRETEKQKIEATGADFDIVQGIRAEREKMESVGTPDKQIRETIRKIIEDSISNPQELDLYTPYINGD